jgi:hypothetical protein
MPFAALGMFVSSWVGTVAGRARVATAIATAAAYVYGTIALKGRGKSWALLTCAIWLVISTGFRATGLHTVIRGLLVLTGGLLQNIFLFVLWKRCRFCRSGAQHFRHHGTDAAIRYDCAPARDPQGFAQPSR